MSGRPTVMTTETLDKLREAFLMGYSDREACLYADIGLQTLYDYQKAHSEYPEQKEQWKENPVLKARQTIYEELEKGNIKTAMWYLERRKRDEFSSRWEKVSTERLSDQILVEIVNTLEREANIKTSVN